MVKLSVRVISGNLEVAAGKRQDGTVYIDFNAIPHKVHGADETRPPDAAPFEQYDFGTANMVYTQGGKLIKPCKIVSLKDVRVGDRVTGGGGVYFAKELFNIDDVYTERDGLWHLRIHWEAQGAGAEIREISYMIIGGTG